MPLLVLKTLNVIKKTRRQGSFVVQVLANHGGIVPMLASRMILAMVERFVIVIAVRIRISVFQRFVAIIQTVLKMKNANLVNASQLRDLLLLKIQRMFK